MARKTEALTIEELAELAQRAEDFSFELDAAQDKMGKRFMADPGDALDLLGKLGRLAENAMALQRMIVAAAKMREQTVALEKRYADHAAKTV